MEFVGEPQRITMPYDEALEAALTRVHLLRHGVPTRWANAAVVTWASGLGTTDGVRRPIRNASASHAPGSP